MLLRALVLSLAFLTCLPITLCGGEAQIVFQRDIQPILNEHCAACHGGVKREGGFSVVSRKLLLGETDSGEPVVVPRRPDASGLIARITTTDVDERMPPEKPPLSEKEISLLRRWIEMGAPWPEHWSYAPVQRPSLATKGDLHPIDFFIQSALKRFGASPAPPADRRTLIRRLSLDLTGLLPTTEEIDTFLNDRSPDAYEKLVDRLLASPHFGERWARHWLDEARYADSEGYEKDSPKKDAYHFRDWVIRAINDDMPFDQFTIRQIAGDLLPDPSNDDLIATKFHLQAQFNLEGGVDGEEDRTKRVIDRLNTVGSVWLATTIGCCQCHNHPYDPFDRNDFYSLYAFFNNMELAGDFLVDVPADAEKLRKEREKKWHDLAALLERQVHDKNLNTQTQAQLTRFRSYDNSKGFVRYLRERAGERRKTYAFRRGDFLQPKIEEGEVAPNTPRILPPLKARGKRPDRLDLAMWLVRPDNPLTARVTVNKVWMHLFGEPLAAQVGDFGSRGAEPTHPELLDWLAHWFMHDARWSRKDLIRLIVTSHTYRQSSDVRPDVLERDPKNKWLSRQNRVRVEAEVIRDIALQASGLLEEKIGGPSVYPPLPKIVAQQTYAGGGRYQVSKGADRYRRGLYTFFRRTAIDPNLSTFDCPDASMSRSQRDRSNNPLQSLALLNNEVFHEAAQAFAVRVLNEVPKRGKSGSDSAQVDIDPMRLDEMRLDRAYLITLGRPASTDERSTLKALLAAARTYYASKGNEASQLIGSRKAEGVPPPEQAAWVATLRVVLNLDEFITRH